MTEKNTDAKRRRALVTGASGDIGAAICTALADAGCVVHAQAHTNRARAQVVVDSVRARGGEAEVVVFDIADAVATRAAIEGMLASGTIDILVHNAGIHDDAPLAGMSDAQWHRVIDVSLHGFFHATQPLLLPMARAKFGRIVAVSSVAAQLGNRGQVNYAAAKSALHGAAKSLAREMASRGVTVNVIAPGVIAGRLSDAAFDEAQIRQFVPAGRAGRPEEVAAAIAFLCSDAAGYVNGQVIGVNGAMA
ncbi:MAG: 3-oxoacyl-ACP reductase FabG [Proteobacteria bacterium]|uniref:3-oxoacyl-ACP reductase FabG n=1 Tax=Rudaea sp. TaxID=2136325 RepID=UPI0032208CCF|nr:3-oxoacyl-ACP reductase FabG [Pseudomonadota bacterium]